MSGCQWAAQRGALLIGQIWHNNGIGINGIQGLGSADAANPTSDPNFPVPSDVERNALVRVDSAAGGKVHVSVIIGEKRQIDWSGNESDVRMLDSEAGMKLTKDPILILGGWGDRVTFRQLALRMLDGSATKWPGNRTPEPESSAPLPTSSDWISLSPLIDVHKDSVGGIWGLTGATIHFTNQAGPNPLEIKFLEIPLLIHGSYELRFKYQTEKARSRGLNVRLPLGVARAALMIGNHRQDNGLSVNGIQGLDSTDSANPTNNPNYSNPAGVEREALVRVELSAGGAVHLTMKIDSQKQIDWSGYEADVQMVDSPAGKKLPKEPILILGIWGGSATVRDLQLRMLDGSASPWSLSQAPTVPTSLTPAANPNSPLEILTSGEWGWTKPVNAGPVINTDDDDSGPFMSADGLTLLCESKRPGGYGGIDLWMIQRPSVGEPWGAPANLGPDVNTNADEYHPSMTADGRILVFSSNRPGGIGKADLYFSSRPSATAPWGRPQNFGKPINSSFMERGSCISSDCLTLIVGSDRPSGVGRNDLWITRRRRLTENFGRFENMGAIINSYLADKSPNLSTDGLVLVFQSDRAGGFGRNDIYMSTRASLNDAFGAPVNLGPTINTDGNEENPSLSCDGKTLWFSSPRTGGLGGYDIWYSKRVKESGAPSAPSNSAGTSTSSNSASK